MFIADSAVTASQLTQTERLRRRHQSAGGVSNIGAEQDEGITSPEIKAWASHTPKQDHHITRAPISLTCYTMTFKRFYLLSTKCLVVLVRKDVCWPECAQACLFHVCFFKAAAKMRD